jgi:hypothetical protein
MNIELDEVVISDVSDDALEVASGSAQGGVISIAFPKIIAPTVHTAEGSC